MVATAIFKWLSEQTRCQSMPPRNLVKHSKNVFRSYRPKFKNTRLARCTTRHTTHPILLIRAIFIAWHDDSVANPLDLFLAEAVLEASLKLVSSEPWKKPEFLLISLEELRSVLLLALCTPGMLMLCLCLGLPRNLLGEWPVYGGLLLI